MQAAAAALPPITQGTLRAPDGRSLPLESTDVHAVIRGPVADVRVEQRFRNVLDAPTEAIYSFPLPPGASVHQMRFRIGERVVEGVIKEKAEARAAYERARSQGRTATLLEQDTPSLFTLSVANVPPGEIVEVTLGYQEVIQFDDGLWRFVFPLVAPTRYHAAEGAVGPRRPSTERGDEVRATIALHGGAEELRCGSHLVEVSGDDPVIVSLAGASAQPNRDLVLTWRAAREGVRPRVYVERRPGEPGALMLLLTPPASAPPEPGPSDASALRALQCGNCGGPVTDVAAIREIPGLGPVVPCGYCGAILAPSTEGRITRASRPRDVTVLVDRSASMRGCMATVRSAVGALIRSLGPGDAIRLIAFDHDREAFDGGGFVALSPEVASRIDAFLSGLEPRGGTELERALEVGCDPPGRSEASRSVVLITDAAVGNEGRLLRRVPELLGSGRRLYVLGIGASLDRRLIQRLARAGRGASDTLTPGEAPEAVLGRFCRRICDGGPILTGLSLSWEGIRPTELHPTAPPDLFGGQPIQILGRFAEAGTGKVVITAITADGRPFRQELQLQLPEHSDQLPGLQRLWARARIEALSEGSVGGALAEQLTALALEHGLVSPFTSLVAEDSEDPAERSPGPIEDTADSTGDVPVLEAEAAPRGAGAPARPHGLLDRSGGVHTSAMPPSDHLGAPPPALGEDAASETLADTAPTGAPVPLRAAAPPRAARSSVAAPSAPGAPLRPAPAPAVSAPAASAPLPPPPLAAPPPAPSAPRRRGGGLLGALGEAVSGLFGGAARSDRFEPEGPSPVTPRTPPPPPPAQQVPIEAEGSDTYSDAQLAFFQERASGALDLVFLVDETGSMGAYIEVVKARLAEIVDVLSGSPLCRSLRIGLVTYRDHPPQDNTYASKTTDLTDDLAKIRSAVDRMRASGGGDGPESVTDGLFEIVRMGWRPNAAKTVVWFGDAPPHGVEPRGDGFPEGCPCGNHWYTQAESCREMGIAVHAVGCVPGIRGFVGAEQVFRTVAGAAGGLYLPLSSASLLIPLIVGAAYTELDKQRIDERLADLVAENAVALAQTDEPERIRWLTEQLSQQGLQPRALDFQPMATSASPMRFRPIAEPDVSASLDRLRLAGRAGV